MCLGLVGYITEIEGSDRLTKRLNTYTRSNPPDSDLSGGWCYPAFEQLGPGFHRCSIFLSRLFFFFCCLTPQKFIDVIFSSLGYCSLQNLSKALPSVNYRPVAQFFPFSVFAALSSA